MAKILLGIPGEGMSAIKSSETVVPGMGERIGSVRRQFGYTQEEFAELLGISPQHLANVEQGRRGLSLDMLYRLRKLTQKSVDFYLYGHTPNDVSDLTVMLESIDQSLYPFVEDAVIAFVRAFSQKDKS